MLVAALLCGAAGLRAQQQGGGAAPAGGGQAPAAPAAAPAAPAQQDLFLFSGEGGLIIFQVKPDKAADFESAWIEIKNKLSASDKPDLKAQGDSMKIYKVTAQAAPDQPSIYVLQVEPAVKASYDPGKIMYAPGTPWERKDADPTYKKIADGIAGINVLPLAKVSK